MQSEFEPMFGSNSQHNNTLTVERLHSIILQYWHYIVICIAVSMVIASTYLRYATPVYIANAKVLVKGEQKDASNGALLEELGMGGGKNNVENEVEIFKSRILMQRVIEHLHLNIKYYVQGNVITTNLYDDAPFKIVPLFADSLIKSTYSYNFNINKNGKFDVAINGKNISGHYGDIIDFPFGKVIVQLNPFSGHLYDETTNFIVSISPVESLVDGYVSNLTVELISKQVSVVKLSFKDVVQQRAEDVLNRLIAEYQIANIEDKTQVAEGTLEFIKGRLADVSSELIGVEKELEGFKRTNKIVNVESQSKLLLDNTSDNAKELTQSEVQLRVLESLDKYLSNNKNVRRVMPATLITQDVTLAKIIEEYNNMLAQRQRLSMSYTENSPYITGIDNQLEDLKSGLRSYITSLKTGYEITVRELKSREGIIGEKLGEVPETERRYIEYARQQQIKQELYLFLLKKREETAISKSATVSNLKIVDPAKRSGSPVSPNRSRIYLIAMVVGIIIPGSAIALKELFNNKVVTKEDIEKATNIPVIAEVAHSIEDQIIVVRKDSKTIISEQFRTLRTNLQFLLTGENENTILITSSMSGEGKSFVSLNLASAIALSGKKVVLLELDLRKPKISQSLNLNNQIGFSSYVIGKSELNDIILPSGITDDFYVIPSGPIPPNPAELILLPKVQQLFSELKKKYDYIIIDTAPVGLVTDAQLLGKYANTAMYVIREGYTFKQQIKSADSLYCSGKLPHMGIIINDVKMNRSRAYGYGNGEGYFDEDTHTFLNRVTKFFKRKNL